MLPSPELSQVLLWVLNGLILALGTLLLAIGKHVSNKLDQGQEENKAIRSDIANMRASFDTKLGDMKDEISRDMMALRERVARVEGGFFPHVGKGSGG